MESAHYARLGKTPLLTAKEERVLTRRIHHRLRALRARVLSSAVTVREIQNWDALIAAGEMSPAELMPRGRKSPAAVAAMHRRLRAAARSLPRSVERIEGLRRRLASGRLSVRDKRRLRGELTRRRGALLRAVAALGLGEKKIRRVQRRITDLARRVREGHAPGSLPLPVASLLALDARVRLIERALERDRNALVKANMRLVMALAGRRSHAGFEVNDLLQEGGLGLLRSIEGFDPARGTRFSTYATWWVRQAMQRAVADQDRTVRLPVHVRERLHRIARLENACRQTEGREPTMREYTRALGLPAKQVEAALRSRQEIVSLSDAQEDEDGLPLAGRLADAQAPDPWERVETDLRRNQVQRALEKLGGREAQVLRLRFGLDDEQREHTLEQIGQMLGITRERVRQIQAQAILKLRAPEIAQTLRE